MGCGGFSVPYVPNEERPGQGHVAMTVFRSVRLSQGHLNALFTAFDDIDEDGSGLVHMDEFFSFFKLEPTDFSREIFRIFDSDGNGQLTFLEFVCVVWNFLTLKHTLIGHYVVYIFCGSVSGNNVISLEEILNMIMLVQGKSNFQNNKHIKEAIQSLVKSERGMPVSELVRWIHDHPMVSNPILHLYSNLRNALIGTKFWNKLSKLRYEHDYMKPIAYIIDLADELEAQELIRLEHEAQLAAETAVLGKEPVRAGRRARRGSLLEQARSGKFNLPDANNIVAELDYDMAVTGGHGIEDEYRPEYRGKIPETISNRKEKIITKKPRRQSLSKALSFVKGIGSSKSKKQTPTEAKSTGKRYEAKRNTSIKMAIDAIKSVTTSSGGKSRNKKKRKSKINQEPGTNQEDKQQDILDLASADSSWKNASKTEDSGWKTASRYQQY